MFTTNQQLIFESGVIEKSFLININQDEIVEDDEVFQIYLENPEGGGSLGAQFRTNITIEDDDLYQLSAKLSKLVENVTHSRAGESFNVSVVAAMNYYGQRLVTGGERFLAIVENDENIWKTYQQRNSIRKPCLVQDNLDGKYTINCTVTEQGIYQLRVWHLLPGGLIGEYFSDAFFQNLKLRRFDRTIDFRWGYGRLLPRGSDYVSIRWTGALLPPRSQTYLFYFEADDHARLWINGELILDHSQERYAYVSGPRFIYLEGNVFCEVIVEYVEITGEAFARLYWGNTSSDLILVSSDSLYSLHEIDRSPILVNITSYYTAANTTECFGDGLFAGKVLSTSYFSFCPRDQYGNYRDDDDFIFLKEQDFAASLIYNRFHPLSDLYQGIGVECIQPFLQFNVQTYCFDGQYVPQLAGVHTLSITYGGYRFNESVNVAGSPFTVIVSPGDASGPSCDIFGIAASEPFLAVAGTNYTFKIVARDRIRNLLLSGGNTFNVYSYEIYQYQPYSRSYGNISGNVSNHEFSVPSAEHISYYNISQGDLSHVDSPRIRFGNVTDLGNGNYSVSFEFLVQGVHELHFLMNGEGISNQPYSIYDKSTSIINPSGRGSYAGQYVAMSPYTVHVRHAIPSALLSSATGLGLVRGTVGIMSYFIVTVRDIYGNIAYFESNSFNLRIYINESPSSQINVQNYNNGSFLITYIPQVTGINALFVLIDDDNIMNSPFDPIIADGFHSAEYSRATGPGLITGTAGSLSYFEVLAYDIYDNPKTTNTDNFFFNLSKSNISGYTYPCYDSIAIRSSDVAYVACIASSHGLNGHYYGYFYPTIAGVNILSIYLMDNSSGMVVLKEISNSPFAVFVHQSNASATMSAVRGQYPYSVVGIDIFSYMCLR